MPTLYIHIGFHKTGSTSLQYSLKKHEKELEEEGFRFLSLNNSGNSSSLISVNLNRSQAAVSISNKFFTLLKENNGLNAIISAEHLSFIEDESEIVKLRDISSQFYEKVKIIGYIRKQHDLAISFKKQAAKQPHINAAPSSQLCGHTVYDPLPELSVTLANYLRFDKKYSLWASVFGAENTIFKLYDQRFLYKSCVCKDFSNYIGLKNELPSLSVNEGFGVVKTELKHFLILTKASDEIVNYFDGVEIKDEDYLILEKNLNFFSYQNLFFKYNENLPIPENEIKALNSILIKKYKTCATDVRVIVEFLLLKSNLDGDVVKDYLEIVKEGL